MSSKCRENESCYNRGCRSEACRLAASEARRARRRLAREAVGESPGLDTGRTNLVSVTTENAPTCVNADCSVVGAVLEEISGLAGLRPGLAAAAKVMAEVF